MSNPFTCETCQGHYADSDDQCDICEQCAGCCICHLGIDPHAPVQRDEAYEYAMLLKELRAALNIKESSQWLTGDMLIEHKTVYAEHTIENIADEIGCAATSLYDYRGMAEFYPAETRAHYKSKGLYYSHLRLARRLKTLDEACLFLDECDLNKWTVFGAEQELRTRKGIDTAAPLPRLTPDIIAAVRTYQATPWHETQALMVDIVEMVAALIGEGK